MRFNELNDDQLNELASNALCEGGRETSWSELADPLRALALRELERRYAETEFAEDDFTYDGPRVPYRVPIHFCITRTFVDESPMGAETAAIRYAKRCRIITPDGVVEKPDIVTGDVEADK